uniref:ASD2 domain-containing protein n=1 Tax=Macrostomum lignano TaxID=282301 RepID=A0A1I8FXQ0_9PLAT
ATPQKAVTAFAAEDAATAAAPPPPRRRQSAGTAASTSVPASAIACPEPPEPRTAGIDSTIPRATYAEQIRQAHRRLQPQQKHPQAVSRHSSVSIVTSRPPELPPRRCRRDSPARFHQDSYIMNRSGFARSESGGQFHRPKAGPECHGARSSSPSLPVSLLQPDVQPQAHGQQQPDNSFARLSLEFNAELRAVPTLSSDSSESPESPSSPFASLSRPFPELAEPEAAAPLEPELGDDAGGGDSDGDGAEDELLPLSTQDAEEPHNESLEMLRTNLGDLRLRLEQAEANLLGSWRQLVMERCQATGALDSYDRYLSRLGPLARLRCQLDRRRRRLRQQQQQLDAAALPAEMEELRQRTCELERQLDEARQLAGSVGRNRRRLLAELRRRLAPGELMKLQEAVQHRMLLAEQAEATRIRVLCAQEHHSPCSC